MGIFFPLEIYFKERNMYVRAARIENLESIIVLLKIWFLNLLPVVVLMEICDTTAVCDSDSIRTTIATRQRHDISAIATVKRQSLLWSKWSRCRVVFWKSHLWSQ